MRKRTKVKIFLDEAKGFMASFNQVLEEGFFHEFKVEIDTLEGRGATIINIRAAAYIPASKKNHPKGIAPFVDLTKVVDSIREQLAENKFILDSRRCEVKTENWLKLDRAGEEITGIRGLKLTFDFSVCMKPKSWLKKS